MIWNVFLLAFTTFACGFLLDNQNAGGQPTGNQQYLTVSEFYHVKTDLQDGLVDLRHDTDNKLVLLSSQLQQMFVSFKQEIAYNNSRSDNLEKNFRDLLQNHTVLQREFDILKRKYTQLTVKVAVLGRSENTTLALQGEISDLKNLKSIHQLQDLTGLQSRVNTISAQTHALAVNEQARNEDFRALYNLTVNQKQLTDKSIKALESETNNNMKALVNTSIAIKSLELNTNNRVDLMSTSFGMKTQKLEGIFNSSMAGLQQQITYSNKRVSMTACVKSQGTLQWSSNKVVKFDTIQLQYGVNNLSRFKSEGKFVAEMAGMYIVSAWIMSSSAYAEFGIYHNDRLITRTYISSNGGHWNTATGMTAIDLQTNDTVWIGTLYSMQIYSEDRSCFTIVKVK